MTKIITFPGAPLPDQPITEADVDKLHSTAFRDMEGEVCDLERMSEIAQQMIMQCTAREGEGLRELELAHFAILELAKMLREFRANYKRWHGQLTGVT